MPSTKASTKPTHRMVFSDVWCGIDRPVGEGETKVKGWNDRGNARGALENARRTIAFKNFALRRGERLLLSDVDLALHAGWRVGVVGRNGTGKSSLFAALRGEVEADR